MTTINMNDTMNRLNIMYLHFIKNIHAKAIPYVSTIATIFQTMYLNWNKCYWAH